MSYDNFDSLNVLDAATPSDGASVAELLLAVRQLKAVVKNLMLVAHYPDGRMRKGAVALVDDNSVGSAQLRTGSVTADAIAANSVGTAALVDRCVTEDQLGLESVTEDIYGTSSIPTRAFMVNSIPLEALGGYITRVFLSSSPSDNNLRCVTTDAIANGAVTDRTVADVGINKLTGGNDNDTLLRVGGVWTAVAAAVGSTALALRIAVFGDVKNVNVGGGTSATAAWQTRTVASILDETGILLFPGSNHFKLIAGNYLLIVECPGHDCGQHQARLRNITKDEVMVWGTSERSDVAVTTKSRIFAPLEIIDAGDSYVIEHYTQTSIANGLGAPTNSLPGTYTPKEVYTVAYLIKL